MDKEGTMIDVSAKIQTCLSTVERMRIKTRESSTNTGNRYNSATAMRERRSRKSDFISCHKRSESVSKAEDDIGMQWLTTSLKRAQTRAKKVEQRNQAMYTTASNPVLNSAQYPKTQNEQCHTKEGMLNEKVNTQIESKKDLLHSNPRVKGEIYKPSQNHVREAKINTSYGPKSDDRSEHLKALSSTQEKLLSFKGHTTNLENQVSSTGVARRNISLFEKKAQDVSQTFRTSKHDVSISHLVKGSTDKTKWSTSFSRGTSSTKEDVTKKTTPIDKCIRNKNVVRENSKLASACQKKEETARNVPSSTYTKQTDESTDSGCCSSLTSFETSSSKSSAFPGITDTSSSIFGNNLKHIPRRISLQNDPSWSNLTQNAKLPDTTEYLQHHPSVEKEDFFSDNASTVSNLSSYQNYVSSVPTDVDADDLSACSSDNISVFSEPASTISLRNVRANNLTINVSGTANSDIQKDNSTTVTPGTSYQRPMTKSGASCSSGSMRAEYDATETIANYETLVQCAHSVGIVVSPHYTGTGFRVGTNLVVTAAHVVNGIINSDPPSPGRPKEEALESHLVFIDFEFKRQFHASKSDMRFHFKPYVLICDEILDFAVLELREKVGVQFPSPFMKFGRTPNHTPIHFIGHSKNNVKMHDKVASTYTLTPEKRIEASKWSHQKVGLDGYKGIDDTNKVLFHCSFEKGASGSPGIVAKPDGTVIVVCMLIHGYPDWYYNPDFPEYLRKETPPSFLIEQAVDFASVKYAIRNHDINLFHTIFP